MGTCEAFPTVLPVLDPQIVGRAVFMTRLGALWIGEGAWGKWYEYLRNTQRRWVMKTSSRTHLFLSRVSPPFFKQVLRCVQVVVHVQHHLLQLINVTLQSEMGKCETEGRGRDMERRCGEHLVIGQQIVTLVTRAQPGDGAQDEEQEHF